MGWERMYFHGEVGKDGLTQRERKFKEDSIAYDKLVDEMIQKQVENMELLGINVREHPDEPCLDEIRILQDEEYLENGSRNQTKQAKSVSTIKSRDAATALSQAGTSARTHSKLSVKTPASLKQKTGSSLIMPKKKVSAPTNPSAMRHAAAAAGSRTTLGYSKGRSVSSTLQCKTAKKVPEQPAPNSILSPEKYMQLYGPPPLGSDMWIRCKRAGYFDDDGDKAAVENEEVLLIYEEDEESRNFQLTV
jgi:CCR4-NOT transcriptional regulation complex NOT5 subunit